VILRQGVAAGRCPRCEPRGLAASCQRPRMSTNVLVQ
jgi:hypothetical protein